MGAFFVHIFRSLLALSHSSIVAVRMRATRGTCWPCRARLAGVTPAGSGIPDFHLPRRPVAKPNDWRMTGNKIPVPVAVPSARPAAISGARERFVFSR